MMGNYHVRFLGGESARKGADLPDPTLATKLYYHYKKNQKLGKLPPRLPIQYD